MSFFDYAKKGWEVAKLKVEAIQELAADEKAFGPALGILAIGGVCGAIGSFRPLGIIYMPILRVIGTFIFVWILHFAATTFLGGKGDFKKVFTPLACAAVVTWIGIIPPPLLSSFLTGLAGLWMLVVAVTTVQHVYQLDMSKSIIAVAIPVGVAIVVSLIGFLIGASFWALGAR
jgi:hypothetical protein